MLSYNIVSDSSRLDHKNCIKLYQQNFVQNSEITLLGREERFINKLSIVCILVAMTVATVNRGKANFV